MLTPTRIIAANAPGPGRTRSYAAAAGVAVLVLIVLGSFLGTYFTVAPYERAVVTRAGAFAYVANPGFHLKLPWVDRVEKLPVDLRQLVTPDLNTYTVDNQELNARLVVQYQLPPDEVAWVYTHVGQSLQAIEAKLESMVIDRWKAAAGQVNVTQIASERGNLTRTVTQAVQGQAVTLYHLQVTDVQLVNIDYQDSFRQAQAQAAVVKTQIEQASGLKAKAAIDAETARVVAQGQANQQIERARGEAESARLAAQGRADSQLIEAQKSAEATVLTGRANAEARRAQGDAEAAAQAALADAVSRNPALAQFTTAQRWNGSLPQNIYASAPIPFLPLAGPPGVAAAAGPTRATAPEPAQPR